MDNALSRSLNLKNGGSVLRIGNRSDYPRVADLSSSPRKKSRPVKYYFISSLYVFFAENDLSFKFGTKRSLS